MTDSELSPEGKQLLQERMKAHDKIEKAVQLFEVIQAISSLSANPMDEAKSISSGDSKSKMNFVVEVVKAYRKEKPGKPIADFFNERYKDKALVLIKPVSAIQEAIRSSDIGKQSKPEPVTEKDVKNALSEERGQVTFESKAQTARNTADKQVRIESLAKLIGDFEGIPAEAVKKGESDVIQRIMKIVDEQHSTGISDADVFKACVGLLSDKGSETKFILEALVEGNREDLLKKALSISKNKPA